MKFGLGNMSRLLSAIDDPHTSFQTIHVAGTNGKGSVAAILETALTHTGYRCGRYTSPHLERLEERFVVGGDEVSASQVADAAERVREASARLLRSGEFTAPPTFFEATTAIAVDLFRVIGVEIAVIEVGLGGRLDSTNVVQPLISVITTIAMDHQAQLGNTIEAIAAEKAGIIKPRVPVVIGRLPEAADAVIGRMAAALDAPLVRAHEVASLEGVTPSLRGHHQKDNALVALATLDRMADSTFPVPRPSAVYAIEHVRWPGRLERFDYRGSQVLLDAAHNPAGAAALASYLREEGWTNATLVFAAMADKDIRGMLGELLPAVGTVIVTSAPTPRAASPDALAAVVRDLRPGSSPEIAVDGADAVRRACAANGRVVVAGSMYLIGPLRGILR